MLGLKNAGLEKKFSLQYEAAVNCCSVTAIVYALSSLPEQSPLSVDDLFRCVKLPLSFVVDRGLTLAQAFDVSVRAVNSLPSFIFSTYFVECYFMDNKFSTFNGFKKGLKSSLCHSNEALIANFDLSTAHGGSHFTGWGGHFCLIGGLAVASDVVMCDTSVEFGHIWKTKLRMLYNAMRKYDKTSGQSRGLIRIARKGAVRPLPGLASCCKAVDWYNPPHKGFQVLFLKRFIPDNPSQFNTAQYITGFSASALALTALGLPCSSDDIIKITGISIDRLLKVPPHGPQISDIVSDYLCICNAGEYFVSSSVVPKNTPDALISFLSHSTSMNAVVAINLDYMIAKKNDYFYPSESDSQCSVAWYILTAINTENREAVIVDTHSIRSTRLWQCSWNALFKAVLGSSETRALCFQKKINLA